MTNIHNLGMTDTEYAQLLTQGYDPNLEHQLLEQARELRPSPKASPSSGADQRQTTPDKRGVGRIYSSLGGLVVGEIGRWGDRSPNS
ncbi:MAG: hypothetical protein V7L29_11605 [Nostoc sp.]|uniref:hypothetical protein n=1 Tax=Nostoc sp. TaxID=1180 RepID=UPI002FF50C92